MPFGPGRQAEMRAYMRRHYGLDRATMVGPHVIVEHVTDTDSFQSTWNTFASDSPDPELGEEPGTCAQFVVDTDGTIYQLVRLPLACRHTVGLNWTAIGIEHVGISASQVLSSKKQMQASLALTLWLADRYGIGVADVIGHNESLTSVYHRERYPTWRCQTHADFTTPEMDGYRSALARIADREHVRLPAGRGPRTSAC
jgi:beta-N-acetylhexosaminidase